MLNFLFDKSFSLKSWLTQSSFLWRLAALLSFLIIIPAFIASLSAFEVLIGAVDPDDPSSFFLAVWECLPAILGIVGFFALGDAISRPPEVNNLRRCLITTDMLCFGLVGLALGVSDLHELFGDLTYWLLVPTAFALCYLARCVFLAAKHMQPRFKWARCSRDQKTITSSNHTKENQ